MGERKEKKLFFFFPFFWFSLLVPDTFCLVPPFALNFY